MDHSLDSFGDVILHHQNNLQLEVHLDYSQSMLQFTQVKTILKRTRPIVHLNFTKKIQRHHEIQSLQIHVFMF